MSETSNASNSREFFDTVAPVVVVGLGGNQGPVVRHFRRVIREFCEEGAAIAVSSLYRSAALGPAQPDFLNAALSVQAEGHWAHGSLIPLLRRLQGMEEAAGRVRTVHWGPRPLDLDLLWAGRHVESSQELIVPHPRLHERSFAILPLLDLVPNAVHAPFGGPTVPLRSFLTETHDEGAVRVAEGQWWESTDLVDGPLPALSSGAHGCGHSAVQVVARARPQSSASSSESPDETGSSGAPST